jgi:hypothetical protein
VVAQVKEVASPGTTVDLANDPVIVGVTTVAATIFKLNLPVLDVPNEFLAVQLTDCTPNVLGAVILVDPLGEMLVIPNPLSERESALTEFQVNVVTSPGLTV